MNVRSLAAADAGSLRDRYGDALPAEAATALATVTEARLLVVPQPLAASALALLRAAGVAAQAVGGETLLGASRAALERARAQARDDADRALIDALLTALDRAAAPAPYLRLRERELDLRDRAHVMGILNVTPDSFYERVDGADAAVERARAMAAEGAALIDVGGQSYAHWNRRITAEEERARVVPAVRAIAAAGIDVALSVDTFKASVADAALAAGAHFINDCSCLSDPALPEVVAKYGAGLVVMHLKGELNVRDPAQYVYRDALAEIVDVLYAQTERALAAGVARDAIAIDPGLEFGKEPETDLEILDRFAELRALGYPILFASSRKSFIGRVFDRPAKDLLIPSLATAALGIAAGARLLRVHDVPETVQLATMLAAVAPAQRRAIGLADRMPGTPRQAGNPRPPRAV